MIDEILTSGPMDAKIEQLSNAPAKMSNIHLNTWNITRKIENYNRKMNIASCLVFMVVLTPTANFFFFSFFFFLTKHDKRIRA